MITSSLSSHNIHLPFCCVLSIFALTQLVLMALFSAVFRRDYYYYYHYYCYCCGVGVGDGGDCCCSHCVLTQKVIMVYTADKLTSMSWILQHSPQYPSWRSRSSRHYFWILGIIPTFPIVTGTTFTFMSYYSSLWCLLDLYQDFLFVLILLCDILEE